ncbi:MAG: hypothetical protein AB1476_00420 [Candidatus Hadarchaeota archaeon]
MKGKTWAVAALLLLAIAALSIYSGLEYKRHRPYPTSDEIASGYQSYVGREVFVFGTVASVAENGVVVSSGELNFTVAPLSAKAGDLVEVLGTLGENYRLASSSVVVYDRASYYLELARSLAGAAILVFVFFRSWKFAAKKFMFVERR